MNMATRNRAPWSRIKTALTVIGQGVLLTFAALAMYAVTFLLFALSEPVASETRCFDTAVKSEAYCRTQGDW